jgi:uncharacterized protein involved in outer membrane biogenesis
MRRVLRIIAIVITSVIVVAIIAAVFFLRSDLAREKVRGLMESTIAGMIDGEVHIGAASGGLLRDLTLTDVSITDAQGQRFISVDTLQARYRLFQLFRRRFVLNNIRLVKPVVLLDQKTGEQWNYARIFRLKDDTTRADTAANNLVVRLDDVQMIDGNITLRTSWQPDSTLTATERENAIARALSDSSLLRVERVGGSYQMVQEYMGLNASLPTVRIIDPSQATMR